MGSQRSVRGFRRRPLSFVAIGTGALLMLGAVGGVASAATSPPEMHMHSGPAMGSTDTQAVPGVSYLGRATPSVALVEALGVAQTAFIKPTGEIDHSPPSGYDIPFAAANGVYLNFNGILVADFSPSHVGLAQVRQAAVNHIFADVYHMGLPKDIFARQVLTNPVENAQLQSCYANTPQSPCVILPQLLYRVYPNRIKADKGLLGDVLGTTNGLTVLRAGNNVPTGNLQTSLPNGTHKVAVIGFTGIPSLQKQPVMVSTELKVTGASAVLTNPDAVMHALGNDRYGAAVVDAEDPLAHVVGIYTGGGADGAGITLAGKVKDTLTAGGISPARGAIDSVFAGAEHYYEIHHFAHAVDQLTTVLQDDPQNAVATLQLADSKSKANTAADLSTADENVTTPAPKKTGLEWWAWILIGLGALVVLGALSVPVYRRRRGGSDGGGPHDSSPGGSWPGAPQSVPHAGSSGPQPVTYPAGGVPETKGSVPDMSVTRVVTRPEIEQPLQAFRTQRHCTECAAQLSPNAKFCGYCAHPTAHPTGA